MSKIFKFYKDAIKILKGDEMRLKRKKGLGNSLPFRTCFCLWVLPLDFIKLSNQKVRLFLRSPKPHSKSSPPSSKRFRNSSHL